MRRTSAGKPPREQMRGDSAQGSRGLRARISPFGVLIALGIANHLVLTGSRVAVSLNALALGADVPTVGGLMALFALLPMLLAIPAGRLADRIGVRAPMLAGSIGMASGVMIAMLMPGLPALFATALLTGVSFMAFQVAAQYATGEMGLPEARTRNFGLLALGYSTSSIVGPLIAGIMIDHVGFRPTFALLTLSPLFPIAVLAMNRVTFPGPHPAHAPRAWTRALDLVAHGELRRVFIINAFLSLAWELHTLFVPIYGHAIGLSASGIGLILAAFASATFAIRLAMPLVARRVPEHRVLTIALYIAAVVYLAFPFSRNVATLMSLSFCLGLGLGAGQPMVMSLLHSHAPPGRMGEAAGVRMSLINSMAVRRAAGIRRRRRDDRTRAGAVVGRRVSRHRRLADAGGEELARWSAAIGGGADASASRRLPRVPALQSVGMGFPELRDFRRNDVRAVRLSSVALEIVLVMGFRGIKRRGIGDFRDDGIPPEPLRGQLGDDGLRVGALLRCLAENDRPILRTDIVALPIARRRVVEGEEHAQQVAKIEHGRIERQPHDLGMARVAAADLFIRRVGGFAAGVAGFHGPDAVQFAKHRVETPEAAAAQDGSGEIRIVSHGVCQEVEGMGRSGRPL